MPAACGGILVVGPRDCVPGVRPAGPDANIGREPGYGEIKRMFVRPAFRGTGLGRRVLEHLSAHARDRGVTLLRLETGIHQHAAIRLYERAGFQLLYMRVNVVREFSPEVRP